MHCPGIFDIPVTKEPRRTMTNAGPEHLFISAAHEDAPLAQWLARKLAVQGYPVWYDSLKSLAGKPWPHTMDDTISHHSLRVLALISKHSLEKKKLTAEWLLARSTGQQRNLRDFLMPLNLDGSEMDNALFPAPGIDFTKGWGAGLDALLKNLDSLETPRSLQNGADLAVASFSRGGDLLTSSGDLLFTNIIRVSSFPTVLNVFQAVDHLDMEDREALENVWTFYEIATDALVALAPPPPEFGDRIRPTHEQLVWSGPEHFRHLRIRDLAGKLILKALGKRLAKSGCLKHPHPARAETFYLPETYDDLGHLESLGFDGKKVQLPLKSKVAFRRAGGLTEINYHYFAFRLQIARGLDAEFHVQLTPTLVLFGEDSEPLPEKANCSRINRIIKTWDNEEWLSRVMAAEHVLSSCLPGPPHDPVLEPGLMTMNSPCGLNEKILGLNAFNKSKIFSGPELELPESEMDEANE